MILYDNIIESDDNDNNDLHYVQRCVLSIIYAYPNISLVRNENYDLHMGKYNIT